MAPNLTGADFGSDEEFTPKNYTPGKKPGKPKTEKAISFRDKQIQMREEFEAAKER